MTADGSLADGPALDGQALDRLRIVALEAAEAGAAELRRYFRRGDLDVRRKAEHDFVTEADHASERRVLEVIRSHYPDHQILAEEQGAVAGEGVEWVIDPLDGTSNFLHGVPYFCVSIGARAEGAMLAAAVLEPLSGDCFSARRGGGAFWNDRPMTVSAHTELAGSFLATGYPFRARAALSKYLEAFHDVFLQARGLRRCGAAALDLAYTAAGVYDGFFELRLAPWDIAAGMLLIEEAGGAVSDLDGGSACFRGGNVVAGPAALHAELLATLAPHLDEATLDRLEPLSGAPRNSDRADAV
ncbi:MAG: inositol monophosphatase family protein [Acidobacteriota bacterium]